MKVKAILVLAFSLIIFSRSWAQPWARTYSLRIEEPAAICATADGKYVYAASVSKALQGTQVLVFEANASGLGVWGSTFDASLSSKAVGCAPLKNGGILVWGERTPSYDRSYANSTDAVLLVLSKTGKIASQWQYGASAWNTEYTFGQVHELVGGGFIACGEISHLNKSTTWYCDLRKGWIVKLDAAGKIVFQKAIELTASDAYKYVSMTDIGPTADGGYLAVGWCYSTPEWSAANVGILLVKLSSTGNIVWTKAYDGGKYTNGNTFLIESRRLFAASDGGCLLVGSDWVDSYPWCAKLDKDGVVAWARDFVAKSGDDDIELRDACSTKDGGCLLGGAVYPWSGDRLGWFIKLSAKGGLKVNRTYELGGRYYNHFLGMTERPAGGFALIGRSYDDYGSRELWAMTAQTNGLTCSPVKPSSFKSVMQTFKLYAKTGAFEFGAGGAVFGKGVFKAASVTATEHDWCASSSGPRAESLAPLRWLDGRRFLERPGRSKDGRTIGPDGGMSLDSLRTLVRLRSSEE